MIKKIYTLAIFCIVGTTFLNAENVARWNLNDSNTSTSANESINGLNAVKEGNVLFDKAGALTSTGASAGFDGNSILEVPHNSILNPDGSFSVSAWVKPTGGTGTTRSFVSSRAFDKHGFIVRIASNNKFRFYVGDGEWRYVEGPTANLDTWYHVLATFESQSDTGGIHSGRARIYINGRLRQSKTLTYKPNTSSVRPFRIGGGGDNNVDVATTYNFIGDIDDVRVANDVKTPFDLEEYFSEGYISRKRFTGLNGWDLSLLTSSPKYPVNADIEEVLTGGFKTPQNSGDSYGAVVEAYYTPSVSGSYVFKLAADDYAELAISTDKNPLNLNPIASVFGWTKIDEWNKYSSQTSSPVDLVAGQTYLLRGIYKEWQGGDHLAVNILINGGSQQVISSSELSPVVYNPVQTKSLLAETLTFANSLLVTAQNNIGTIEGTFSEAAIANLQIDINTAQEKHDDVNSSGRDFYQANWDLIAKVKSFSSLSEIKLWGEIIGSQLSWVDGREYDKAFDGRLDTYVDTLMKSGWTGIDLGEGKKVAVSKIRFFPRAGHAGRMPNAKFQGSNDGTSWTQLHKITSTPQYKWQEIDLSSNSEEYRFYRFYDPDGNTNVAEVEFYAFEPPELKLVLNKAQSFSHGTADQIIRADHLRAEHAGLYHDLITYTLTVLPVNGVLKLDGVVLAVNDTFTQQNLDDGKLTFTDDESHVNGEFSFTVADVIGGTIAESEFSIILDSDLDGIDDASEISGSTDWNQADSDGDGESDFWEIQNGTDPNTDTLSPAITALEGENGVSASFWYDSPGSLANFKFDRGPMEVKKLPHIALSQSYSGKAGGSSRSKYVVARYESYLWVPIAGEYTFELISDDGSRMFVEGAQIINNDGTHSPVSKKHTMTFGTPGFKKIKVEYFQASGYHTCQLLWSGPGQPHRLIPSKYFYLKIPDHKDLLDSVDSDGDFLTDVLETQIGTAIDNKDSDGDKLLDGEEYHAVYGYQTNPLAVDTDGDKMSDWDEIFIFLSNPTIADFSGEVQTAFSILPKNYDYYQGIVRTDENAVFHESKNAFLHYDFDVATEGIYLIEIDLTQHLENSTKNNYNLNLYIDDMLVNRQYIKLKYGETTTAKFLSPNLSATDHKLKLFIDNVYEETAMKIIDIRFSIPTPAGQGEANWLQNHINNVAGLKSKPTTSKTSPVCIEGKCRYLNLIDSSDRSIIKRGTWNHWYANIPLAKNIGKQFSISYQNGLKTDDLTITWEETNILNGGTMTIRKGDSLLLNVISGNEDAGIDSGSVTINGGTFAVDPDNPKEYKFDTAGLFEISGTQTASNGVISNGSISIKVVEAPEVPGLQLWEFRPRTVTWPQMDGELNLDGKGLRLTKGENNTYTIERRESLEDINILTRLGENGPIFSRVKTQPFWLYELVEGYARSKELIGDDVNRVKDTVFLSPFAPDDIEVRIEVFVSGVTFEDGTTVKTLKKTDFDALGLYELVLLKDIERTGSICHRIKVYQNGELVGQRR